MRAIGAILAVAMLAACAAAGDTRDDGARRNREVAEATAAWAAAYNSRDPARITALYDADAVFWGTTSATIRTNPAAIADYFKNVGSRPDGRVAIIDQQIRVDGDTAFNAGSYTFTDMREGKDVTSPARFTFIFRSRGGRWVIVHHHSSRIPAP